MGVHLLAIGVSRLEPCSEGAQVRLRELEVVGVVVSCWCVEVLVFSFFWIELVDLTLRFIIWCACCCFFSLLTTIVIQRAVFVDGKLLYTS